MSGFIPHSLNGVAVPASAGEEMKYRARSSVPSKSTSSASDKRVADKLDELFGCVQDTNERLRLMSKAIGHLQQMQAQIM